MKELLPMCFSATASFVAAGVLTTVGVASWQVAKPNKKMIATVPILFGVQQAIEGAQWVSSHPSLASTVLGYAFLAFAWFLWPVFIPAIAYAYDPGRQKLLRWFVVLGVSLAGYFAGVMASFPLSVSILDASVYYGIFLPYQYVVFVFYLLAICGSLLATSQKWFRIFAVLVFFAAVAAAAIKINTFGSVWCFFAAALSVLVFFYLRQDRKAVDNSI